MKKEVAHNVVVLVVLAVAIMFIFANANFNFTGHVTIGDQECDGEWTHEDSECIDGTQIRTWTNITDTTCESPIIEENVECEIEVCDSDSLDLCLTQEECEDTEVGGYWYVPEDETLPSECRSCLTDEHCEEGFVCTDGDCVEEDVCDIDNLNLCNQTQCDELDKYWYDSTGDEVPECNNICLTDEHCEEGFVCTDGDCVEEDVCDIDNLNLCNQTQCDELDKYWYDSTGDEVPECNSEEECVPRTCDSLDYECGSTSDGCDSTLDCGECGSGYSCNSDHICEAESSSDDDDSDSSDSTGEESTFSSSDMITSKKCTPSWECSEWSECIEETQTRTCTDSNNCNSEEGKPEVSQSCTIPETCFDGIRNQDEQGVDCGGVCEKSCSIFTIAGSVISGPIESFAENKVRNFIFLGIFVCLIAGVILMKVFWKQIEKKLLGVKFFKDFSERKGNLAERIFNITKV